MKAKEHILNLKTIFSAVGSYTSVMTDKHLMYVLDEARAVLAAQKMDAGVNITAMFQHVDQTPSDSTAEELMISGIGYMDTNIVKKLVIPKPIQFLNGEGISTIGDLNGSSSFSRIDFSQIRTSFYRKYTGSKPKWVYLNNDVFIYNYDTTTYPGDIRVRGVFDEPWRVLVANGSFNRLNPWDFEYPLSMKDEITVYKLAMQAELGWGDSAINSINVAKAKSSKDQELLTALKNLGNAKV